MNKQITCIIIDFFELLWRKRNLLILQQIKDNKATNYTELKNKLTINTSILSQRLNELQEAGYIKRVVEDSKPVKITYLLTDKWISFGHLIDELTKRAIENNNKKL